MSFKTRHEMILQGTPWERDKPVVAVCCDGMAHNDGEGSLRFWLEVRHPEKFDFDTRERIPAHVMEAGSHTVYSYHLVTKRRKHGTDYVKADSPWHLREMVLSLAREDVGGKSAASMIYHVFWYCVAKNEPPWLLENAPEWWRIVDPKRRQEQYEAVVQGD